MADVDPEDMTDAELASMAAAALSAVHKQRRKVHDDAAAALADILALLAAGLDPHSVAAAINADTSRNVRRDAVAAELTRQARVLGLDTAWHDAARAAHTAATLAGAAAAAHVLSAGHIPAEPDEPGFLPDLFDPAPWVAAQQAGLAGDVIDAIARAAAAGEPTEPDLLNPDVPGLVDLEAIGITAEELAGIVEDGAGALYYLDVQVSEAYLDATTALYLELGFADLWWCALGDSRTCPTCIGFESGSPYTRFDLPGTPHGGCRCFVMPGAAAP